MKGFKRLANTDFVFQDFDKVEGTTVYQDGQVLVDFASSAYLGLSFDVEAADLEMVKAWGMRNHWSRISGNNGLTRQLEMQLESDLNLDHVRLAQSISLINLTFLKSVGRLFDAVIMDEDSHITIKMGVGSNVRKDKISFYPNNDLEFLENKLQELDGARCLVVIDGVYSMKGNVAPVRQIISLLEKYDGYLYIDDAHGFGVLGENGMGVIDGLSKEELDRVIYVGSFSKAASNPVAFVGVNDRLIEHVDHFAPCLIYSGPPSNFHVAVSLRHLNEFRNQKFVEKRERLLNISEEIHQFCFDRNMRTLSGREFPLLALSIEEEHLEVIVSTLKENGIFAKPAIYPVVKRGDEIIRFTFTASITEQEIEILRRGIERISPWTKKRECQ